MDKAYDVIRHARPCPPILARISLQQRRWVSSFDHIDIDKATCIYANRFLSLDSLVRIQRVAAKNRLDLHIGQFWTPREAYDKPLQTNGFRCVIISAVRMGARRWIELRSSNDIRKYVVGFVHYLARLYHIQLSITPLGCLVALSPSSAFLQHLDYELACANIQFFDTHVASAAWVLGIVNWRHPLNVSFAKHADALVALRVCRDEQALVKRNVLMYKCLGIVTHSISANTMGLLKRLYIREYTRRTFERIWLRRACHRNAFKKKTKTARASTVAQRRLLRRLFVPF
jgi:hypothetical protein